MNKEEIWIRLLNIVANAYETGNFDNMFSYLSEDCVWESQWVIKSRVGKNNLKEYYNKKGKMIKENKSFCKCEIFECSNISGLGLLVEQNVNNETMQFVITIKINNDEKISRIDISHSDFYYNKQIITQKRNGIS